MSWRMRTIPVAEPGIPDRRSPSKLLLWVGRQQIGSLVLGVVFGIAWMVAQALMPYTIGRAVVIDDPVLDGSADRVRHERLGDHPRDPEGDPEHEGAHLLAPHPEEQL